MDLEPRTEHRQSTTPLPAAPTSGTRAAAPLKVLFASSEVTPFAKTGGLGDVVGALPRALAQRGHSCLVMLPLYRSCRAAGLPIEPTDHEIEIPLGVRKVAGRLCRSHLPGSEVPVYLVEQPELFERDDPEQGHGLYQQRLPNGRMRDYIDNCQRFIFFSRAILEALPLLDFWPDVLHCNDWQTGLIPVHVRELYEPADPRFDQVRTLYTIHNLAYQGVFWHWDMVLTGLDWRLYNWRQLEFYGHLNLMKAGIVFADRVSTVSARYAQEIQTAEQGCGLESVLRHYRDKLIGIINGVDYRDWSPATDPHLVKTYTVDTVAEGKAACKAALQERLKLPLRPGVPLLGMITRLAEQKGLDLLAMAAPELLAKDIQLVVLGTGDAVYHELLRRLMQKHPEKFAAVLRFDERLAHQIEAGVDIFLMPSRFEPAGLNQLYSLKYGTVPVVRSTGGLSDTVTDCTAETLAAGKATGFVFTAYTAAEFLGAINRALAAYREPVLWRRLQQTSMSQDWSWERRAVEYEELYYEMRATTESRRDGIEEPR